MSWQKGNVGIDIHLHDRKEAGRATIKEIIRLTKEYAMAGNVFISHAFGLNDFEGAERTEVFQALADQDIHIVSSIPISQGTIPPLKNYKVMGLLFTLVVTIFMILGHHWVTAPCKKSSLVI